MDFNQFMACLSEQEKKDLKRAYDKHFPAANVPMSALFDTIERTPVAELAKHLGISQDAVYRRKRRETAWKASELEKLMEL